MLKLLRTMNTHSDIFETDMNAALRTWLQFVFGAFGDVIAFFIFVAVTVITRKTQWVWTKMLE